MGKIVDDFGDPASTVSFLASDNEDVEVGYSSIFFFCTKNG